MPRRVSLPAADALFRPGTAGGSPVSPVSAVPAPRTEPDPVAAGDPRAAAQAAAGPEKRPSGRVRHDEKMTVYLSAEELIDLEQARLTLRRDQGLAVDRGRMVREALAIVLADLEANGDDSVLVSRLTPS